MVGGEREVRKTSLFVPLVPPEMLQSIVGELQPDVVRDVLRRTSTSFPIVEAKVAAGVSGEVVASVGDVKLPILVDLRKKISCILNQKIISVQRQS